MNEEAAVSVPTCGVDDDDATDGYDVALSVGDNDIPVVVVAPDGSSTTYRLHIARAGNTALLAATAWTVTTATGDQETLNPALALEAGSTTEYTTGVAETVAEVTVAATPADADGGAKAKITSPADADGTSEGHQVKLAVGKNPIMATVTAKDGSTKTYTLTITRGSSAMSSLSALEVTDLEGDPTIAFTQGEIGGHDNLSVAAHVDSVTIMATPEGTGATVEYSPEDADPNTKGHQVALTGGKNTIKVIVTSSDGSTVTTYTLEVFRATINEHLTKLDLTDPLDSNDVPVDGGISPLFPEFDKNVTSYVASVPEDVVSITLTADSSVGTTVSSGDVPSEDASTEPVDEMLLGLVSLEDLVVGKTQEIEIEVVSSDRTSSTTYTVTVLKVQPNAQLTKLSLGDDGKLSPKFVGSTTSYSATVKASTEQVTVEAVPLAGAALAGITPVDADDETDGHQVDVGVGETPITVEVTHGRGASLQTTSYLIAVTREAPVVVEVVGPTETRTVTQTQTRTVTKTVEVPVPAASSSVIGMTGAATATEVDGRVLITRHDGGASLVVDLGGFIRDADFGQTYQVVRRADGAIVRQWVSPNSPLVYQIPWAVVNSAFTVPVGVVGSIPLDDMAGTEGQLVRRFDGGDDRIFSYAMGQWRHVPDIPTFQALGLYWCDVTAADASFFDRISMGAPYPASSMAARMDYPSCSTG